MKFFNFLFLYLFIFFNSHIYAEIIDNKKITNKDFDVWRVSCEEDEMLGKIRCKLFVEMSNNTTFFVSPKGVNKILVVSKNIYYDKGIFLKVDNHSLIESKPFSDVKYGVVEFNKSDIELIFKQMQTGKYVYIRYYIKDKSSVDGFREITLKFSLNDFKEALDYYNKQINKYNIY